MQRKLMDYLRKWAHDPIRTPLILRGARQVGKSHLIREFGIAAFSNLVEVNLETHPEFLACFGSRNPHEILMQIEVLKKQQIIAGKTLLFIDEIQSSKDALLTLRSFKEQMPELHVIAAGSLLEFALQDDGAVSFPVGRVSFAHLHPLSFCEFLLANDEALLADLIGTADVSKPPPEALHNRLLELVRTYLIVGGMPEVVETLRITKSLVEAKRVQNRLMIAFAADFAKYGRRYDHRKLQQLLAAVPRLVGKKFKYVNIDSSVKARDFKLPLQDLERAGLVRMIRATSANGFPLGAEAKEGAFRVQHLDIGLMLHALGLDLFAAPAEKVLFINEGALAEQLVGQELLASSDPESLPQLYCWWREVRGAEAEVDFVHPFAGKIVPIEVKAGVTGRLKSLRLFMEEKKQALGVRVSQSPLSLHDGILSVPLYMVSEISRLLRDIG